MPIYAYADIFSWAVMDAICGTLMRFMTKARREKCRTHFAAGILAGSIVISFSMNHNPIGSARTTTMRANISWIVTAVE